jgi:hypothetical protein
MCHRYHGDTGAGNVKPRDLRIKNRNRKNSIGMGEEATSRGYFTMWSGLARSRFGRPQAVLKSKCISHDV